MKQLISICISIFLTLAFGCKSDTNNCVCIEIYQPVCGSDGKTYSNSCYAECAKVSYVEGNCPEESRAVVFANSGSESCPWIIQLDLNDEAVDVFPDSLPATFQQHGLAIKLVYRLQLESKTCEAQTLQSVEVIEIEKR